MAQHTRQQLFAAPYAADGHGSTNNPSTPFPAADAFVSLASSAVIPPPESVQVKAAASSAGSSLARDVKAAVAAVGSFMDI